MSFSITIAVVYRHAAAVSATETKVIRKSIGLKNLTALLGVMVVWIQRTIVQSKELLP